MLGNYKLRQGGEGWMEFQSDDGKNDLLIHELDKGEDADKWYPQKSDYLVELNFEKQQCRYAVRCNRVNISMVSPNGRDFAELRRLAVIDIVRLVFGQVYLYRNALPNHQHDPLTVGIHYLVGEQRVYEQLSQARVWNKVGDTITRGYAPFQIFQELNPAA